MGIWKALLLGTIQGFTEFLPISSSGHLVLGEYLLGITEGALTFTIIVHLGSLVAVFVAMWYRIGPVISGTLRGLRLMLSGGCPWSDGDFRWGVYVIVGTVPAVIIGLLLREPLEGLMTNTTVASSMLIVTGMILMSTHFVRDGQRDMGIFTSLIVGLAQAFAILPGISRSGSTITAAMWSGVERLKAAEYSFLLSIPVIVGPALLEIGDIVSDPGSAPIAALVAGFLAAAVSGYFAIRLLLGFVRRGRLSWFAYYCWAIGITGLILC